ncbi:CU044_5270 family protein [Kribbella sp. NPDC050281]|uniref:CU044_5270 family protein n=1 Tax=Kribbella sp. NPDC050281 TaxID=3155515 RepID=UPI0033E8A8FE
MNTNDLDTLKRVDPASGIPDGPLTDRELAGLQRIATRLAAEEHVAPVNGVPAAYVPARRGKVRRRAVLVGAAGAVAVAGAGVVVVDPFGSGGVAMAATPPLLDAELAQGRPGKAALLALAATAAADKTLPGDAGSHTVRMQAWNLSTAVDSKERVTSAIIPEDVSLTWNSDLSGRLVVRTGQPYSPDPASHKDSVGKPGRVKGDQSWPPGRYQPMYRYPLPSDPARLLAVLKIGHDIDANGPGQLAGAVTDLYREATPAPAVRAAVLKILADHSNAVSLGAMTDRSGRKGRAFAVDSSYGGLPNRHVLIFDPRTGRLWADETVLTKTAGRLNVRIPAVISYNLYL